MLFGILTRNQEIKNPQTYKDVMSYCEPIWISPYHYMKIINDIQDYNAYSTSTDAVLKAIKMEHLFLRFVINRSKTVKILPSFHYSSRPIRRRGKWTPFVVELRSQDNNTIESQSPSPRSRAQMKRICIFL
jgi:hypothetical protein